MKTLLRLTGAAVLAGVMFMGVTLPGGGTIGSSPAQAGYFYCHPYCGGLHDQIIHAERRLDCGVGNPCFERHLIARDRSLLWHR